MEQDLTLRETLAEDRLDDFVRQEEDRGVELAKGSDLERALALLVTQRRLEARSARSTAHGGEWAQRGADRSRHRTSYSGPRCGRPLFTQTLDQLKHGTVILNLSG
jgi:hypothetical protein